MVLAYASSILIVQNSGPWPNNSTQLNQTNFGLCVADLVLAIIGVFIISFWYSLPYNSVVANILSILYSLYLIAYNSTAIYFYRYQLPINNNFYDASIAVIVLGSILILFELIRRCFNVSHWIDGFVDDDFSVASSEFYAIQDIIGYWCYDIDLCDYCGCCGCFEKISEMVTKYNQHFREVKLRRKQRNSARMIIRQNPPTVPPPTVPPPTVPPPTVPDIPVTEYHESILDSIEQKMNLV